MKTQLRIVLVLLVVLLSSAACGGPTAPSVPAPYTLTLSGTVAGLGTENHSQTVPRGGTAVVVLTWSAPGTDLDLYITGTSCTTNPFFSSSASCQMQASSTTGSGVREQVTFTVTANQSFKIWADNFSFSSANYTIQLTVS